MKNIKLKIYSLLLLIIGFISCEDYLIEEAQFTLNEQTLFVNEGSAQLALNACYSYVSDVKYYGQGMINATELPSGIAFARKNPGNSESDLAAFNPTANSFYVDYLWEGIYKSISESNLFINAAEKSSLEKDYLIAQARFLRGLSYYNLAHLFGGVPLRLGAPTPDTTDAPRATQQEVLDQVILDLEFAANNLYDVSLTIDSTVPSNVTANAMLAKVYFMMASKEGDGSSHWATAKAFGDKVFAAVGSVPLEPNYADLFDADNRESIESLFTLVYGYGSAVINKNSWMQSPYRSTPAGINYVNRRPTIAFFNHFRNTHPGDSRIDASMFHTSYFDAVRNKTQNCYPIVNGSNNNLGHVFFKKHFDFLQQGQVSYKSMIVYRYADFLLLMADVENELGNIGIAVGYVNQVLSRARTSVAPASMEPADISVGISKIELRDFIFEERLFELSDEGHSFMDTRRRGVSYLKKITTRHNADPDVMQDYMLIGPWSSHKLPEDDATLTKLLLLPISIKEINTNKAIGEEDQNPGINYQINLKYIQTV